LFRITQSPRDDETVSGLCGGVSTENRGGRPGPGSRFRRSLCRRRNGVSGNVGHAEAIQLRSGRELPSNPRGCKKDKVPQDLTDKPQLVLLLGGRKRQMDEMSMRPAAALLIAAGIAISVGCGGSNTAAAGP